MNLASIVEGHGEVGALPVLLRRIADTLGTPVHCPRPHRVKRQKVVQAGELERALMLQSSRAGPGGGVLVLLDADDDCAVTLARTLASRARASPRVRVEVVLAVREFESWFLTTPALSGRGVDLVGEDEDPDAVRSPKSRMPQNYAVTVDQARFAALVDLERTALRSRSFLQLTRAVSRLVAPTDRR